MVSISKDDQSVFMIKDVAYVPVNPSTERRMSTYSRDESVRGVISVECVWAYLLLWRAFRISRSCVGASCVLLRNVSSVTQRHFKKVSLALNWHLTFCLENLHIAYLGVRSSKATEVGLMILRRATERR